MKINNNRNGYLDYIHQGHQYMEAWREGSVCRVLKLVIEASGKMGEGVEE